MKDQAKDQAREGDRRRSGQAGLGPRAQGQPDVSKRQKISHGGGGSGSVAAAAAAGGGGDGGAGAARTSRPMKKLWRKRVESVPERFRAGDKVSYKGKGDREIRRGYLTIDFEVRDAESGTVYQDPLAWALGKNGYNENDKFITSKWRSIFHHDKRHDEGSKFRRMHLGSISELERAMEALTGAIRDLR